MTRKIDKRTLANIKKLEIYLKKCKHSTLLQKEATRSTK